MSGRQEVIREITRNPERNDSQSRPNPALPEIMSNGNLQELADIARPEQQLYCEARDHRAPSDPIDSDLLDQKDAQAQIADGLHQDAECKGPMFRQTVGNIPGRKVRDTKNLCQQKDLKYLPRYLCVLSTHP